MSKVFNKQPIQCAEGLRLQWRWQTDTGEEWRESARLRLAELGSKKKKSAINYAAKRATEEVGQGSKTNYGTVKYDGKIGPHKWSNSGVLLKNISSKWIRCHSWQQDDHFKFKNAQHGDKKKKKWSLKARTLTSPTVAPNFSTQTEK